VHVVRPTRGPLRLSWIIIGGSLSIALRSAAAQIPSVRVDSSSAQIEVTFPALPLGQSGCRFVSNVPGVIGRSYSWRVWASFRYPEHPINHLFRLEFEFHFPDEVELTEYRFDSIAAANPVEVAELYGEPPIFGPSFPLEQVKLQRRSGRFIVAGRGRQAVDALLRTKVDSLAVSWCERNQWPPAIRVVPLDWQ
jgi:hypothetical protein